MSVVWSFTPVASTLYISDASFQSLPLCPSPSRFPYHAAGHLSLPSWEVWEQQILGTAQSHAGCGHFLSWSSSSPGPGSDWAGSENWWKRNHAWEKLFFPSISWLFSLWFPRWPKAGSVEWYWIEMASMWSNAAGIKSCEAVSEAGSSGAEEASALAQDVRDCRRWQAP